MEKGSSGSLWGFGHLVRRVLRGRRDGSSPSHPELSFESVEKVLALYVAGLMGREIGLEAVEEKRSKAAYTNTRTIFLPAKVAEFPLERDNFSLYKLMAAHKCAQIQYGTFHIDGSYPWKDRSFGDQKLLLDIFDLVENERVEFLLTQEFKGLQDELALVRRDAGEKRPQLRGLGKKAAVLEGVLQSLLNGDLRPGLRQDLIGLCRRGTGLVREVLKSGAVVEDSMAVARELYGMLSRLGGTYEGIHGVHYRGELRLDKVEEILKQKGITEVVRELGRRSEVESFGKEEPDGRYKMVETTEFSPKRVTAREVVRGEGSIGSEHLDNLIWLDMDSPERANEVSLTEEEKEGAVLYSEWNYRWSAYRKEWCVLRERAVREGDPSYVEKALKKHRALVSQIRKQFEALRPELRKLKKQSDGEEIDIDNAIESLIDQRLGSAPNENVYISRVGNKRDIAVAFLVDLSGSVGGWIPEGRVIDIEKEGLVLICEALQLLDDKYAIFGFSSSTRKQCDFHVLKGFGEPYSDVIRSRIAGIRPFNYTRMGVSIRHAALYLTETEAKIKLMILISDGKPNDFDGYTGRYAIEDTRSALAEARQNSIRTFCITVDTEAQTYVPEIFGEGGYIIIDNVAHLPAKLPEMYRRLTT